MSEKIIPNIYQAIVGVMTDIDAIGKNRQLKADYGPQYSFRGIEDMYNEFHPKMAKWGVFCAPRVVKHTDEVFTNDKGKRVTRSLLEVEYTLWAADGTSVTVGPFVGEGIDNSDKASNKAMSQAHKYMFIQVFVLATQDEEDPDASRPEVPPDYNKPAPRPSGRPSKIEAPTASSSYKIPFGQYKGMAFDDINPIDLAGYVGHVEAEAKKQNKPLTGQVLNFVVMAQKYLETK